MIQKVGEKFENEKSLMVPVRHFTEHAAYFANSFGIYSCMPSSPPHTHNPPPCPQREQRRPDEGNQTSECK